MDKRGILEESREYRLVRRGCDGGKRNGAGEEMVCDCRRVSDREKGGACVYQLFQFRQGRPWADLRAWATQVGSLEKKGLTPAHA